MKKVKKVERVGRTEREEERSERESREGRGQPEVQTYWKDTLILTEHPRAMAEISSLIFLNLHKIKKESSHT